MPICVEMRKRKDGEKLHLLHRRMQRLFFRYLVSDSFNVINLIFAQHFLEGRELRSFGSADVLIRALLRRNRSPENCLGYIAFHELTLGINKGERLEACS